MEWLLQSADLFHKGGPVMYALLFCSVAVVAITAERFLYYRQVTMEFSFLQERLQPLMKTGCIEQAWEICSGSSAVIEQVAADGLLAYCRGRNVEGALENAAAAAAARLRKRLNYLSAIVTLAPLLGLLGTVVGMIDSFSVFNVQAGQPLAITGGIGEALIATATGLCVAITAMAVHTYFAQRLDGFLSDIEQVANYIVNDLPASVRERRGIHEGI